MNHKIQPDGFTIWHSRHGKRWCWRQTSKTEESKILGHIIERTHLRTRPAALQDLYNELERRELGVAANASDDRPREESAAQ